MKLIKFLIKFILFILILAAILVGIVFYAFSDSKDEAPVDLYDSTLTTNSVITPLLNDSLTNLGTNYAFDLTLTEENTNKIVYSLIKEKINTNYNPKTGTTDQEKYINSDLVLDSSIPVVGGKKLLVKNGYVVFNDNDINICVTADAFGLLKTKLTIGLQIETKENEYVLTIKTLKLGKLDLRSGIGKSVYDFAIKNNIISEQKLNSSLSEKNIPFTLDLETMSLTSTKEDFGNYLKSLVATEDESSEVIQDFVGILTDPQNNMINLNTTDSKLKLQINLDKLKVEESLTTVSDDVKQQFDTELFIQNKVQTMAINMLATSEKKLTFTEMEFGRLIYTQTNEYNDLAISQELIDGVNFSFSIEGITVDITETKFTINLILNINGLKTLGVVSGTIEQISDTEVHVNMPEKVQIGDNLEIGSGFINSLLSESMNDVEVMKYDGVNKCFVIKSSVFDGFIQSTGTTGTPINVSKIKFIDGALALYVDFNDPIAAALLTTVTNKIETIIASNNFVDTTAFNTTDEAQAEVIENITENLTTISQTILNPSEELSEEDTQSLIENINNLSEENQEIFMNQLQNQFVGSDLTDLYDQLFPQGNN